MKNFEREHADADIFTSTKVTYEFISLILLDSIDFNDHHIIDPKIIHAKHKRAVDNTLEKVSVVF